MKQKYVFSQIRDNFHYSSASARSFSHSNKLAGVSGVVSLE